MQIIKKSVKFFSLISLLLLVSCGTIGTTKEMTPEGVANQWLTFAKEQKWGKMVDIAQLTWASNQGSNAEKRITWIYDFFDIKSWKITSISKRSNVFYTITVEVDTQLGKKIMKANVIKEIEPYQPSVKGKWGINPPSATLN